MRFIQDKEFEKKAYEFLKTKFEDVKWLSEYEPNYPFDFLCIQYGKEFKCDAKSSKNKPSLNINNDIDLIIIPKNDSCEIIYKTDFNHKVYLSNSQIIKIRNETKIKLDDLKIHYRETYDDIINRLIIGGIKKDKV